MQQFYVFGKFTYLPELVPLLVKRISWEAFLWITKRFCEITIDPAQCLGHTNQKSCSFWFVLFPFLAWSIFLTPETLWNHQPVWNISLVNIFYSFIATQGKSVDQITDWLHIRPARASKSYMLRHPCDTWICSKESLAEHKWLKFLKTFSYFFNIGSRWPCSAYLLFKALSSAYQVICSQDQEFWI